MMLRSSPRHRYGILPGRLKSELTRIVVEGEPLVGDLEKYAEWAGVIGIGKDDPPAADLAHSDAAVDALYRSFVAILQVRGPPGKPPASHTPTQHKAWFRLTSPRRPVSTGTLTLKIFTQLNSLEPLRKPSCRTTALSILATSARPERGSASLGAHFLTCRNRLQLGVTWRVDANMRQRMSR